jgi:hypothetical protein
MTESDRRYLHTLTAGAWLPVVQSLITGIIVFILVLVIGFTFRFRSPWTWSVVIGGLVVVVTWFILAGHWYRLTDLETWTGIDFNHDGVIGDYSPTPTRREEVRVYVSEVTAVGHVTGNQKIIDFPCSGEQLRQLAEGLLTGVPLAERGWTGAGRPFSTAGFRSVRAELIKRGLVALASDKDTRRGYVLTVAGRNILARLIEELTPSPT